MTRKPQQQRAKATVDAIVEAGFICVADRGAAGTTTRHIADVAGISVGSLYEYFANKEMIFDAMNQRFVADVVAMLQPLVPVIANVTASPVSDADTISNLLVEQVTGRVRWRESIAALRDLGVDTTVECGGNKVLTGMVKRIDKDLQTVSLDTPEDLEAFGKGL